MNSIGLTRGRPGISDQIASLFEIAGYWLGNLGCDGVEALLGQRFDRIKNSALIESAVNIQQVHMEIQIQTTRSAGPSESLQQCDGTGLGTGFDCPDVLQSYTDRQRTIEVSGRDLSALFEQMDAQFPGLRFRIINELDQLRPHIKVFVNHDLARNLHAPLNPDDEIVIVQAGTERRLNWNDKDPIYRQLRDRIVKLILDGVFSDDSLPSGIFPGRH